MHPVMDSFPLRFALAGNDNEGVIPGEPKAREGDPPTRSG